MYYDKKWAYESNTSFRFIVLLSNDFELGQSTYIWKEKKSRMPHYYMYIERKVYGTAYC